MSAPAGPLTRRCTKCGETKSLSGFSGAHAWCKACNNAATKERKARRRAEMGEEAWLAWNRENTRKSRLRHNNERGRAYNRAKYRAVQRLIGAHPRQFEAFMTLELDAEERREAEAS